MTRIAYFDAFSGISGDMTVGALIDAGASAEAVIEALYALPTEARYEVEKVVRGGIAASKFRVHIDHVPANHRHLQQILEMIDRAAIASRAKANASAVFQKLGEAEAGVHGVDIKQVHFHEVGAADSIADIVGACVALDLLAIDEVHCSAINVGSGTVNTEHGMLPVPAPATARLLEGKPIYARGPEMELTTPTGAAIASALALTFGPLPAVRIASTGYGAGDRDFRHHANVLRALIGERSTAPESTLVSVIEANIDDSTPQVLGYALERLMLAGALDASLSPLQMKKNRPGSLLRVIAKPEDQERLAQIVFEETSTLGLRIYNAERRVEEREVITVETQWGIVRGKITPQGVFVPEYEDCRAIAGKTAMPLHKVITAANAAFSRFKEAGGD
jgi:pyridinium-3,5-bisthiocarboxylic acid mononucleotide nickel chelatase